MSPSRRNGWRNHKRPSEPDRWLDELGFYRKHTPRDPSCLFRVVSENVYNTQRFYNKVRMECVQFMSSNRELFEPSLSCSFDNYLKEIANPGEWGGLTEIAAMSHLYGRDFVVFEASKCPQTKICNGYDKVIFLYYISDSKHFDAVYTKDHINSLSYSQSLVYEILYKGVFEMKEINYAIEKMLYDRVESDPVNYFSADNLDNDRKLKTESSKDNDVSDNNSVSIQSCIHKMTNIKNTTRELELDSTKQIDVCFNCIDVKDAKSLLETGITPFPYKVAKALDPEVYRNIEFDVWTEWRREIRYGSKYSDGTTLQVGAKCLCRLKPDQKIPHHCHIQQMAPDGGPCLVFVEGIGEMRLVDFNQLEPLPLDEVRPWAPPYRQSRSFSQYINISQILKQLGNDSQKLGATRTRSKVKPSQDSVSLDGKSLKIDVNSNYNNKLNWNDDDYTFNQNFDSQTLLHVAPWAANGPACNNFYSQDVMQYNQVDYFTFEPYPVEITAMPLKIEPRNDVNNSGGTSQQNGPSTSSSSTPISNTDTTTNNQQVETVRASTPSVAFQPPLAQPYQGGAMVPTAIYNPGMKLYPSMAIPPNVNPHQPKSIQLNGSDLPMNDIPTLRFFFNLGIDCLWGGMCPAPPMPPPRLDVNELTQDLQQGLTLQDRPIVSVTNGVIPPPPSGPMPVPAMIPAPMTVHHKSHHKHNGQRPLIGPRFKRGNNENNHNGNQNNKGYNMGSKGSNHRRNSVPNDIRPEEPLPEPAPQAYLAYPPPVYPFHYYSVDEQPGMMGYMGGYYVEELDYGSSGYFPTPMAYPPPMQPHLPPHPHITK